MRQKNTSGPIDSTQRWKANNIAFKGAGWTEGHNCLFFGIPTKLTGLDNNSEECYNSLTNDYGIYPLGTWNCQSAWVSLCST